ncbi:MAG: sigma-70 family RNA polymerase sigma factor [Woeseiaceae bacterium]
MTFLGKQKNFQQLTHPWRDRLCGVALRQTSTRHMAEDWVQETLLRAWKDFGQLSEGVAIYAWLLKILDHVIADDRRKEKRRYQLAPIITVDDEDLLSHPCSSPGPFENMLQKQESEQLNKSIENLPDEFRRVVLLRDIEGLSYNEVSYILDIPKGTVMSRLSRGRRILASALIKSNTKFNSKNIDKTKQTNNSGVR